MGWPLLIGMDLPEFSNLAQIKKKPYYTRSVNMLTLLADPGSPYGRSQTDIIICVLREGLRESVQLCIVKGF